VRITALFTGGLAAAMAAATPLPTWSVQRFIELTDVVLDSYRTKVRDVVRVMDALVEHRAQIPVGEVQEMHDELLAAAAGLAEAFKLEN